jgi:peptidoglycan/xylan/chitin deacetylase (PgdA/CDA1 family)
MGRLGRATRGVGRVMPREISIVLYHRIADDADPLTDALDISIRPEMFERHVRYFAANFDVIAPADLLAGRLPRRPLLITFDDAYRSVLDVAAPVLKSVAAPSLFFLNPRTIEQAWLPLPNLLSLAMSEIGLAGILSAFHARDAAIDNLEHFSEIVLSALGTAEIEAAKRRLLTRLGADEAELRRASALFLSPGDLASFAEFGIALGNHSLSHPHFRSLPAGEIEREIVGGRDALRRLSGQPVPYFSVPYGDELDATERVLDIARASGHRAIFLVHNRSNRFRPAADIFYRIDLGNAAPEDIPSHLLWRPFLRTMRHWTR